MAETRNWNYLDEDNTDAINQWQLGIHKSGVYCGFDLDKVTATALQLKLIHTGTGIAEVDKDLNVLNKRGVMMTKQGVVIKQDAAITLVIGANATANYRIDTIYCEHEYIETMGGAASTIAVIQGTAGATPVAPALANPEKQTVIGYLVLPPNFSDITVDAVEWIKNVNPLHEDISFIDWASLAYDSTNKLLTYPNVLGNLFYCTLTSTKELKTITNPTKLGKLIKVWFKTDGSFITGGNITIDYAITFPANSYVELISYQEATGQVKWRIIAINKGPGAYLNEVNQHTKTIEAGYALLDGTTVTDYDNTNKRIITHGGGNAFIYKIANGQEIKNIVNDNSLPTLHQDGTTLLFKISVGTSGHTATLNVLTGSINTPEGYTTNYTIVENDILIFTKRAGTWDVIIPTDLARRLALKATAVSGIAGMLSQPYAVLGPDLVTEPAGGPGQQFYKDSFGRVWPGGKKIKATSNKNYDDVFWVFPAGYLPANAVLQNGEIIWAVPVVNESAGPSYSPAHIIPFTVDPTTGQVKAKDYVFTDDILDFRGCSFLS